MRYCLIILMLLVGCQTTTVNVNSTSKTKACKDNDKDTGVTLVTNVECSKDKTESE